MRFEHRPQGPFDLRAAGSLFGGWPAAPGAEGGIVVAFPLERRWLSAAVVMRQGPDRTVIGDVHGAEGEDAEAAWRQALAALSLDVDGSGFPEVGRRDRVVGRLQEAYPGVRPVLFHSPYEAAAGFTIGHRISISQGRRLRAAMAEQGGQRIQVDGQSFAAFPSPRRLLELSGYPGIAAAKFDRLHAIAHAALEGRLDRERLRALPVPDALAELQRLPGIGPFFAQGILMRGAGLVDANTDSELTRRAVQQAYELRTLPGPNEFERIASGWRPYRMWVEVLMHVWFRRDVSGPGRPAGRPRRPPPHGPGR
jgi:DNA-3-methyladenine glycosylase II